MLYCELYSKLKRAFDSLEESTELKNLSVKISRRKFTSNNIVKDLSSLQNSHKNNSIPKECNLNYADDFDIECNNRFDYYTFENTDSPNSTGVIVLFHGLNEKKWDKYLPWAYSLSKATGKMVILFPLSFHMNRAPLEWSNARLMKSIAERRSTIPNNSNCSFANAAISERLETIPQRFFWSGYQTYMDFCNLLKQIRSGKHDKLSADVSIDLFGYSIGAFLSLWLMLDNPYNYLENSRLFIFCGGTTYDKTFPVSKYIVDHCAYNSVFRYYQSMFLKEELSQYKNSFYFGKFLKTQSSFPTLMEYYKFKDTRDDGLNQIYKRIKAVALVGDEVIPPHSVEDVLKGSNGNINTSLSVLDFPFPYNHVVPFPLLDKYKTAVDKSFNEVFDSASSFIN